jgi:predicted O-linked N-acetylglucosamine transferase (SPINDLY family)
MGACDIVLDSIGWSGCNSTLESLAHNLPIVTFAGELMRGRHTSAILTMMRLGETVAHSLEQYISIAVDLGRNADWRVMLAATMEANKHRIYRDSACIGALEEFFEATVREVSFSCGRVGS